MAWFNRRSKGSQTDVAAPPAASPAVVPEVTPVPAPVADLEPRPATTLPTEPATPPAAMEIPPEKIAALAYEIWVEKGRPPGTELQNWLEAEAELRIQLAQQKKAEQAVRKSR